MSHNERHQPQRATESVRDTAAILGVSRDSVYDAVKRGDLDAVRIGKRIVIPRRAIHNLLASAKPERR